MNLELWAYYFPLHKSITNVRLGVAPFFSVRAAGDDGGDATRVGALFEVRAATTDLEY